MGYTFTVDPDNEHGRFNTLRREGAVTTVWTLSDDDILALDDTVSARASAIRQARWDAMDPPRPGPAPTEEREYRVTWTIEMSATHPRGAAIEARAAQVRPGTTATVFEVREWGGTAERSGPVEEIDLTEDDVDAMMMAGEPVTIVGPCSDVVTAGMAIVARFKDRATYEDMDELVVLFSQLAEHVSTSTVR